MAHKAALKPQTQVTESNGITTIWAIEPQFRLDVGKGATLAEAKDRARTRIAEQAAHLETVKVQEIAAGASKRDIERTMLEIDYLSDLIVHIMKL